MKIKKIEIKNYRSLKNVSIDFSDLTILIGKNDAGKSNVLKALDLFFNWNESKDFKEISGGSSGSTNLDLTTELKDNRLFFKQYPNTIEIVGYLDIEEIIDAIFPEEVIKVTEVEKEAYNFRKESIEKEVAISILGIKKEEVMSFSISFIKIGDLFLLRPGPEPRELIKIKEGYSYDDNQKDAIPFKLLQEIRGRFFWIPANRFLKKEERTKERERTEEQKAAINGTDMANMYLQYEKNITLGKIEIFEKIKADMTEIFQEYKKVASMEEIGDLVDVYFDKYPSSSVGDGIKQLFISIFNLNSYKHVIFGIEEPEIHLHPELQREVLYLLEEKSKDQQIMITTHSPIFANKTNIQNVRLLKKDDTEETNIVPITEDNVYEIIEELGIKPSDILDDDVIVFVEGESDVEVFKEFVKKLKPTLNACFIDSEGFGSMNYYANEKITRSKRLQIPVFIVFDGDTETDSKKKAQKEIILEKIQLPPECIKTLDKSKIEDYLLIPRAIKAAFPNLNKNIDEISDFLTKHETKQDKKKVLDLLFKDGNLRKYRKKYGAKIAEKMNENEISQEIKELFDKFERSLV